MMTERNTSNAAHAVLLGRLHPCVAAPPNLQKVASPNPTIATPTMGLRRREYMYCPAISASCATLFLGSTWTSNEGRGNRHAQYFIGQEFLKR
jgi:hypothetical protein